MYNQDLIELVEEDINHTIQFLKSHNLKVKGNKVTMLFSDGEVDETKLDQLSFTNLWELEYEPSLVKVEFIIEKLKELNSIIIGTLEILLDKIVGRTWHVDPNNTLDTSTTCPHFKSINIDKQNGDYKIKLIGAICYCS